MLDMGIIKVEINFPELIQAVSEFSEARFKTFELLSSEIKMATANAINQLMNAEMAIFLGKSDEITNKRNGFETKEYAIKGIGSIRLRVPVDRRRKFESKIIPKHEVIDPRLKEDMAILHLAGLSTRTLGMISKRLLGIEVSHQTVSTSLNVIEKKALNWLSRPITEKYWALYVDGTNFKIQRRGSTESEPSLVVLGINQNHRKSILAIEPGTKDNVDSWRAVFKELKNRGLNSGDVRIGVMDGLPGLENLFKEEFPNAVTARCWVHALKNALVKTPARLREPFKKLAHRVMYSTSENTAKEAFKALKAAMGTDADRAVKCLEKDLDALLVHYRFDKVFWTSLRTTNPIERINREFKKRFNPMGSLGERKLECLLAFTALKLEMGWSQKPVNTLDARLFNFKHLNNHRNQMDEVINTLIN